MTHFYALLAGQKTFSGQKNRAFRASKWVRKTSFSYQSPEIVISYQGTKRNGFLTSRFFCQKYCRGWIFCSRARALARAREQKNHPKVIFEVKNGSQKTVSLRPRGELCFSCDWNTKNEDFGFILRLLRELYDFAIIHVVASYHLIVIKLQL